MQRVSSNYYHIVFIYHRSFQDLYSIFIGNCFKSLEKYRTSIDNPNLRIKLLFGEKINNADSIFEVELKQLFN